MVTTTTRTGVGASADSEFELVLRLPGAAGAPLELTRVDDDLAVTAGGTRRIVALPSVLRRCTVTGARLAGDDLCVVTTLHGTDITIVGQDPSFHAITKFSIEKSDKLTAVSEYLREPAPSPTDPAPVTVEDEQPAVAADRSDAGGALDDSTSSPADARALASTGPSPAGPALAAATLAAGAATCVGASLARRRRQGS